MKNVLSMMKPMLRLLLLLLLLLLHCDRVRSYNHGATRC